MTITKNYQIPVLVTVALILGVMVGLSAMFVSSKMQVNEALAAVENNPAFRKTLQRCFYNYNSWPNSNNLKIDAPWSTLSIVSNPAFNNASPRTSQFLDVNGDGLVDFIHSEYFEAYNQLYVNECLLLNNGQGWSPAYRCKTETEASGLFRFYGDCAQL
jgi:hypothetical protein